MREDKNGPSRMGNRMIDVANLRCSGTPRRAYVRCSLAIVFSTTALLLGACAVGAQSSPTSSEPKKIQLVPCTEAGVPSGVRCGRLEVFENRAAGSGRKIALNIVVLPAKNEKHEADALFFLPGGPGYGGADSYLQQPGDGPLGGFREKRDVVFVDYRGTGRSHPLPCPIYPATPTAADFFLDAATFLADRTATCREQLSKDSDLTRYTTPNVVDDLDDVRAALGFEQINLYGTSYGSRVALIYMRRHPAHLRSVILEAVETTRSHTPLYAARGMQHALDRLLEDCAADAECHAAFPKLKADLETVLASLDKSPAKFDLPVKGGPAIHVEISNRTFVDRLIQLLYNPGVSRILPFAIHQAASGDFTFYASAINLVLGGAEDSFSRGMYLSVMCSEDVGWISDEDAKREMAGTLMGMGLIEASRAACKAWPRSNIAADYTQPVTASVPVLLLAGDLDPVTPAWLARDAAAHLPNSLLTVNPMGGHGTKSRACQIPLMEKFVEQGSGKSLDVSCVANSQRPAFVTDAAGAARMLQF